MLKPYSFKRKSFFVVTLLAVLAGEFSCRIFEAKREAVFRVRTLAGFKREFGEPFGVAIKGSDVFVSDGMSGAIFSIARYGSIKLITDKLNTPSAMAFDARGNLIVADSGNSTILRVNISNGETEAIAGIAGKRGFADGDAKQALFNSPIGVEISPSGKIYVADTYNDRIRVIADGRVSTLAGGARGFADGAQARFDTPCEIAFLADGRLLVADTGNRRLRVIDENGITTTFAGTGETDLTDAIPLLAKFVEPTAVAVDKKGRIFVADGNAIRVIGGEPFPFVRTISNTKRGIADGDFSLARFNRPTGLTFDPEGNLYVADSDNQLVRVFASKEIGKEISFDEIANLGFSADEFRKLQPARWCYDPPQAVREIAGTLGEIRGDYKDESEPLWFHNGLDVVGSFGETARFVRTEKVLRAIANENFGGRRELLRMPTMGYVHLRLGRDKDEKLFPDERFQFEFDAEKKPMWLRIPRGTKFEAGEAIGTVNEMYHVHLIAGKSGSEMNALDALELPGANDSLAPKIENVFLFDENWQPVGKTPSGDARLKLKGKIRVVARAFDQMNENASRRKLGVYKLGYQILQADKIPLSDVNWTISFAKMPEDDAVRFVYAKGSRSGYTPDTVFDYIITNEISGDIAREGFLDTERLAPGNYLLRVFVADFFGNIATQDLKFEIAR